MKSLLLIFWITSTIAFSQNIKEVLVTDLVSELNSDTTAMVIRTGGELVSGKYKLIGSDEKDYYTLMTFVDGKANGLSESYRNGILIGTTEYKNGLPNGYSTVYEQTGKQMLWKISKVNGRKYGHAWFLDKGDSYYINDKEVSKEQFEKHDKGKR